MECADCVRLSAKRDRLEREYAKALARQTAGISTTLANEYRALLRSSENARTEWEFAVEDLERHQRTHAKTMSAW